MRALERDGAQPVPDDAAATEAGRAASGDMEAKLVARAKASASAAGLRSGLQRFQAAATWLVIALLALAACLGAGAARAALGVGAESRVNFFFALGTLLGVQTIVLAVWFLLMLAKPAALHNFSLGGLMQWAIDRLMRRSSRTPAQLAAMEGAMVAHGSWRIARWSLSTLSHAAWLSFNFGCIATLFVLLSTRQYTFVWETTILSERAYAPLVKAISAGPRAAGFGAPSEEEVAASQWTGSLPADGASTRAAHAWAALLVGSIVVYGALPRVVMLLLCAWRLSAARRAYRLDVSQPGFSVVAARLAPVRHAIGVIDADDNEAHAHTQSTLTISPPPRPLGSPAIVGVEIERTSHWPPRLDGITLRDLGVLLDRPDRQRVMHELRNAAEEPMTLVIACALTSTPDRGMASILAQLQACVSRPALVVLTAGQSLRERTDAASLERRVADWRACAAAAGIAADRVIELDIDHATHASLSRLREAIEGGTKANGPAERRIERAFATIMQHVERWCERPEQAIDHRAQTSLHRDILRIYGSGETSWRSLLASSDSLKELTTDTASTILRGASHVAQLIPPRWRVKPRWAIAGASAGALSCVAAAMLLAPAAIGAMPLWSAVGGAIAGAVSTFTGRSESAAPPIDDTRSGHIAAAVRAAALTAMLLDLQGRPESAISRVLDRVIAAEDEHDLERNAGVEQVRHWLEHVRHHYDLAVSAETRP